MTELVAQNPSLAIVLNRDLMFGSRIRTALSALGLEPRFVAHTEDFVRALKEHSDSAVIGIIDMNGVVSWSLIEEAIAGSEGRLAPVLAFGPHVDVENRRAAKAAGVTRIVSNGQFHSEMATLIDRYRKRADGPEPSEN